MHTLLRLAALLTVLHLSPGLSAQLDRYAIVERHRVRLIAFDTMDALTVGNGRFAVTVDATGLQTFPDYYRHGVSLGTLSTWGWHAFPNDSAYTIAQTLRYVASHGRRVPYAVQWPEDDAAGRAAEFVRANPHRLPLASIGWDLRFADGRAARPDDIRDVDQQLDLWNGTIVSRFTYDGQPVEVTTAARQDADVLLVRVSSPLLRTGRLALRLRYPYPTGAWEDAGADFADDEQQRLHLRQTGPDGFTVTRTLDTTRYRTDLTTDRRLAADALPAGFLFRPGTDATTWTFSVGFAPTGTDPAPASAPEPLAAVAEFYHAFWNDHGTIDFGAVEDPRARELERRMVLSRYLMQVNCSGGMPPQETGLTYNSWYGRPHLEMAWWHGVHFALWGQPEVLAGYLDWYRDAALPGAERLARRQGFAGARWQKMTDPWGGETASSIGSYLLWQQPHPIYFAELLYRLDPDTALLRRYGDLVAATADFMADFAHYDPDRGEYVLGPGVIAAQERFGADTTVNTTFELAYWRWGLETAQTWRRRAGIPADSGWDTVLTQLSPLPVQDGLYLAAATAPDSYTNAPYLTDHPSVLAAYGLLPATAGLDTAVMRRTLDTIWRAWSWEETWGWDFPLTAFTAARLGATDRAIDALLMDVPKNHYLTNGHNPQRSNLRVYLPGNGGLLAALAMLAVGDGFPAEWRVRWEGLRGLP